MEEQGHKDYRSIGEILRDARVAQNKSVEDVAELTKIAPKSIQALEADDLDRLAGPVYIRSFTKTLGEALSLDVEFLLTKLSLASSAMGDPTAQVKPIEPLPTRTRVIRDPSTAGEQEARRDETTWHVEKVRVTRIESSDSGSPLLRWMLILSAVVVVAAVLIFLIQKRSADGGQLGEVGLQQSALDAGTPAVLNEFEAPESAGAEDALPAPGAATQNSGEKTVSRDDDDEEEIVPPQQIRPVANGGAAAPGPQRREDPPAQAKAAPAKEAEQKKTPVDAGEAQDASTEELVPPSTPVRQQEVAHEEIADPSSGNLGSILRPDDSAGARPMRSLHLSASEDVEVWVASDGDPPKRYLLRRGASMTVEGRDHFSLRLEDASSVVVVLDGVRHDPPAGLLGEWIIWADDAKQ